MTTTATPWHHPTALAHYRAMLHRCADRYLTLDVFDRPSLRRPDIRAADAAIQAAFKAQDYGALAAALAQYERAVIGGPV
jgi:hypothetical protein